MITHPVGAAGVDVSVSGQRTWYTGEDVRGKKDEIAAPRLGIELGLTL